MMDENRCEDCWWHWTSVYGDSCHHPANADRDPMSKEPCGWFEAKVKAVEIDEYERFQNEWN